MTPALPRNLCLRDLVVMSVAVAILRSPAAVAAQADTLGAKVDAIFVDVNKTNSPGCALGVVRDGRLVYARGYGMANLDNDIAISPASTFYIASTSKQFAAASMLLLAQEGKISLDDDVRKYIPELPNGGARVTIRHLIHHTRGIRDYLELIGLGAGRFENVTSEDEVIALLGRQKALNFTPGGAHSYSNSGYFLLSVIVKRVTGTSLREYADKHIFKPLGMHHTHFHDDRLQVVKRRVIGYDRTPTGGFRINYYANFEGVGDGGLWTTVEDLALWDRNFYDATIGGPEFLTRLEAPGLLASGDTLTYSSGLISGRYRGIRTVSHGGAFMGYRAQLLRFPEQRFSVICICNLSTTNPTALARKVADVYLAGEFGRVVAPADTAPPAYVKLPAEVLVQRTGVYRNATTGMIWNLVQNDSGLVVKTSDESFPLAALSASRFRNTGASTWLDITFEDLRSGQPARARVALGEQKPEIFDRIEQVSLTPAQLAAYAGEYYSDELRASYQLTVSGDTLFIQIPNSPKHALTPTIRDSFVFGGTSVTFVRNGGKRLSAFRMGTARLRNMRFERMRGSP